MTQTILQNISLFSEDQQAHVEDTASKLSNRPLLRPDEVARFFDVNRSTVYRWIDSGKLVASNPGGRALRIMRNSVEALLLVNKFA